MPKAKMVRVSESELRLLKKARTELKRRGYASLQDLATFLSEQDEHIDPDDLLESLTLGAIAALGALAIMKRVSESPRSVRFEG